MNWVNSPTNVTRIGFRPTMTLTRIQQLLKMNYFTTHLCAFKWTINTKIDIGYLLVGYWLAISH